MPAIDPLYDLVLMLDSAAPDDQRQKVLSGAEQTINGGGEIVNSQDWGVRQTAYEIRHKTDAEYHLLQFHATRETLERLGRTLRIADGVVRFRVIKLRPGTPAPPASRAEPRPTGVSQVAGVEPDSPEAEPAAAVGAPAEPAEAVAVAEPAEAAEAVAVAEPAEPAQDAAPDEAAAPSEDDE